MIDQLRQMAIFAKAIDRGSFRGAAKELGLSPSVVSHHISQLEESLGIALIYRSTRKLALTKEGAQLLTTVRDVLEAVESELLNLSVHSKMASGEIRITAPAVLTHSNFPRAIAHFSKQYPRVKLFLDFTDTKKDLIKDGFDIAIGMGVRGASHSSSRRLFQIERKIVTSVEYLEKQGEVKSPRQLINWDWLLLSPVHNVPQTFQHMNSGKTETIKPKGCISSTDAHAICRLVEAGSGVAILPEFLTRDRAAAAHLCYPLQDWNIEPISIYATWPQNAPKNGLVHMFLNELGTILAEMG